ncbi:MAG: cyclic nucleotide-binding domain-containing protein [Desulfobacteraceae bacterium]|nr:cyclic nucleotide-binding domain-containing protein [Desulfobacteraceae bacterium]
MKIKQADILWELDKGFVGRLMEVGVKSHHEEGEALFTQGEAAQHFYILVKGSVRLSIGDRKSSFYTVSHGGEAFGWSALTGRYQYTASAVCVAPSTLIAFDRDEVETIMNEDPANAALFYKNLSLTLGNRLMLVASQMADHLAVADKISYGTGQVQEVEETA